MANEYNFSSLLVSSTPKSCNLNQNPAKRRVMESPALRYTKPVPITPMPDFNNMDTPEIQQRAQRYGLKRKMAKSKLRTKLQEVYMYSHQVYTSPHNSESQNGGKTDIRSKNSEGNTQNSSKNSKEPARNIVVSSTNGDDDSSHGTTHKDISQQSKFSSLCKDICQSAITQNSNGTDKNVKDNLSDDKCPSDCIKYSAASQPNDSSLHHEAYSNKDEIVNLCDESFPEACTFEDLDLSGVIQMHDISNCETDKSLATSTKNRETDCKIIDEKARSTDENNVRKEPSASLSLLDSSGESEQLQRSICSPVSVISNCDSMQKKKIFPFKMKTSEQQSEHTLANDSDVSSYEFDENCKNDLKAENGNCVKKDNKSLIKICNGWDLSYDSEDQNGFQEKSLLAANIECSNTQEIGTSPIDVSNHSKAEENSFSVNAHILPQGLNSSVLSEDARSESMFTSNSHQNDVENDFYVPDDLPQSPYTDLWSASANDGVIAMNDEVENLQPLVGDKEASFTLPKEDLKTANEHKHDSSSESGKEKFEFRHTENNCDNDVISLLDESGNNSEHEALEPLSQQSQGDESQELAGSDHEDLHRSLFVSVHQGEFSESESSSSEDEEEECKSLMQRLLDKKKKNLSNEENLVALQKEIPKNGFIESKNRSESLSNQDTFDSCKNSNRDNVNMVNEKEGFHNENRVKNETEKLSKKSEAKAQKKTKKVKLEGVELTKAIYNAIHSNHEIYSTILQYKPVYLSQFKQLMIDSDVCVKASDLLDFLDSRGITFSTADENKNKASRTAKRKSKKSAKS